MRTTPSQPSNVAMAASAGRSSADIAATTSVASTTLRSPEAATPGTIAMTTQRSAALTTMSDSACLTRARSQRGATFASSVPDERAQRRSRLAAFHARGMTTARARRSTLAIVGAVRAEESVGDRPPSPGDREHGVRAYLPGLATIKTYSRHTLSKDLIAGLVLTTLLVPQGMAYAELAGLPPITGLHTSVLCLLAYAVFGPSRVLVLGPDSSVGPMIAVTGASLIGSQRDPQRAVALASMLSIIVGLITAGVGIAKLGFVADLLSKPTQIGYMTGLALTIMVGQLPKLFGFSVDADGLIPELHAFINGLGDGKTVTAALVLGLCGIALIVVLQRWFAKVPGVLLTV